MNWSGRLVGVVVLLTTALGCSRPALLGTRLTMSGSFYPDRLRRDGVDVVVPTGDVQANVDRIICEELTAGVLSGDAELFEHLSVVRETCR